ncbi:MAG: hypothetical protein R3F43_31695 [bacterium]
MTSPTGLLEGPLDEQVRAGRCPDWHYPGSAGCDRCHPGTAGFALGWRAEPSTGRSTTRAGRAGQLGALAQAGYLEAVPAGVQPWPPLRDAAAPVVGVPALCWTPTAPCATSPAGRPTRSSTCASRPPWPTGLCAAPTQGGSGPEQPPHRLPGAPLRSVLLNRMSRRDEHAMPPSGQPRRRRRWRGPHPPVDRGHGFLPVMLGA